VHERHIAAAVPVAAGWRITSPFEGKRAHTQPAFDHFQRAASFVNIMGLSYRKAPL
jgi:hypothetical protein